MKLGRNVRPPSAARFDVVTFGENSLDTIVVLRAGELGYGKARATSWAELPGGQAATAAVACARLGWRTRYVGASGDDAAGRAICEGLWTESVDVQLITRAGASTRRAVIEVDATTGDRRVIEYRDPALDLGPSEIPDAVFADARILLVDATDLHAAIRAAQAARSADVRTVVDVDRPAPGLAGLLRLIDIIVMPESAVAAVSGEAELGRGLEQIGRESGAAAVIATCGAEGSVAWCDGREIRVPGHPVEVVDTTGAGDAFRAGLIAGWVGRGTDSDLEGLLADASLVGSLNCRGLGAQTSLPRAFEVPRHLRGGV